jgi:pimeloyl-ACP methyl ester carboxylesterase
MSSLPGFVFVHGAWHDHHTWDRLVERLQPSGFATDAFDLPGAGVNARRPLSYFQRPLDAQAFATEPSPNAQVTQAQRNDVVIAAVRAMAERTGRKVVLVGHSLGGATVSHVAQAVPELLGAVVYVCGFMLPQGMKPVEMIKDPLMAEALVPSLFVADPPTIGAMRVDFASEDAAYRERIRQAYCGDLDEAMFAQALSHFHCDEPAQVVQAPSPVTRERYGTLARHYLHTTEDRAITPAGQLKMIGLMDAAMGGHTVVHTLKASHSPFDSQPDAVAGILEQVAQDV